MTKAPPLTSWHAQRSAGGGGTRVFNREWRAHGTPEAEAHVSKLLSEDQVAVIRRSKHANGELAEQFGVSITTIRNVRAGNIEGTPVPFVPLCMSPEQLAGWQRTNDGLALGDQARSPCQDCLWDYAIEMRAIDKCNGTPGAAADVEDEEPDVTPARKERAMATATRVAITAPCATCLHEPVCARRLAIEKLNLTDLYVDGSEGLPAGLTLALSATIDCDAYLRVKGSHKASAAGTARPGPGAPGRPRTPAQLAALAAARETLAAKRAAQTADVDGGVTAAGSVD